MARKRSPARLPTPRPEPLPTGADPIAEALRRESEDISRACAGGDRLTFRQFFERYPTRPDYKWGRHTVALCEILQQATETVERGESFFAVISMPPRHGKSDLVSRRYPTFHLTRNPDHEVMLVTYAAALSIYLGREAKNCFDVAGQDYGLRFAHDANAVAEWRIADHRGGMICVGLDGTVTGKGANILIIDDYCKNRDEAESETIREKTWDAFSSDLITRRAKNCAVIIIATRYHEDDLAARIFAAMRKDERFPRFQHINFPAWEPLPPESDNIATDIEDGQPGRWLFPEMFDAEWYRAQRLLVREYGWQAQYQGDPRPRTGQLLRADLCQIVKLADVPRAVLQGRRIRGWDLASTEKQRVKDDPDFTVGTLAHYDGKYLWVLDVVRGQWAATRRDQRIVETSKIDGSAVRVRVEAVAGYKDAYNYVRMLLSGKAIVNSCTPGGQDKVARAAPFEPRFEAGLVKLVEAPWNREWISEFMGFPKGKHDDQVDSFVIAATPLISAQGKMSIS